MCRHFNSSKNNNNNNNLKVKRVKSNTFQFGKCRICDDDATGFHYGVQSCEGCKVFYKRSTLKNEKYHCYYGNTCELKRENRKKCKACRYRACVESGMAFERVKMGRIPNSLKEKMIDVEPSDCQEAGDNHTSNSEIQSPNLSIQPLKKRLLRDYKSEEEEEKCLSITTYTQTESKFDGVTYVYDNGSLNNEFEMNIIRHFLLNAHEKSMADVHSKLTQAQVLVASGIKELQNDDFTLEDLWTGACQDIRSIARSLISLVRDLPELKQYDISKVSDYVRSKLCNFFVLSRAQLFLNGEIYFFLPNGIHNTTANFSKLVGNRFTDRMIKFFVDFNSLDITTDELALLIPFVLSEPDQNSPEFTKMKELRDLYGRLLNKEFSKLKRDSLFVNRLHEILLQLDELNLINETEVLNIKLVHESFN